MAHLKLGFAPGIIITSFLVSTAGAWVALELLRLRTSNRGWVNWVLLILASLVTGTLAIFVMHFVGMAAVTLDNHGEEMPLYFETGMTIGSLFESIFCVCVGVYVTGAQEDPSWKRFVAGGAFAALGITLMHFTAMRAMRVTLEWIPVLVALSCAIAWLATTSAFMLFFRLRAMWQNSWWKQFGCAVIFAGAICAMHYIGMVAATYSVDPLYPPNGDLIVQGTLSVDDVLRVGIGLSGLCACVTIALLTLRVRSVYQDEHFKKAQLVLAILLLDHRGHVMVDNFGHLPSRAVIGQFNFNAVRLPIMHPAMLWLLKASSCWSKFAHLGTAFRKNGARVATLLSDVLDRRPPTAHPEPATDTFDTSRLPFYRLSLIQAVASLAASMGISLGEMGLMYDQIIKAKEGWVVFLVDRLDSKHADVLATKGFRWTEPKRVLQVLAGHLQVHSGTVRTIIGDVPDYVRTRKRPVRSGLHVGVLSVYPRIGHFEVMVPSRDRSSIPTVEVSAIAFAALMEHAPYLREYVAPVLSSEAGAAMVVADYVAASEIHSALMRLGIGLDSGAPLSLQALTPPEDVLVLHRRLKHQADHGSSRGSSGRDGYPWVSRVPFPSWKASPNSSDSDMLLFVQINSFTGGQPKLPAGFQLIDLTVFEAMHYSRCFSDRFRRVIGMEMNEEWDQLIIPTFAELSGHPLRAPDAAFVEQTSRDSHANSANGHLSQGDFSSGADLTGSRSNHSVLDVDEILREGPSPTRKDLDAVDHNPTVGVGKSREGSITRAVSLIKIMKSFPPEHFRQSRSGQSYSDKGKLNDAVELDDFQVMIPHKMIASDKDDEENESIPQVAGPDASPIVNAWQAMRWVKLYVNAAVQFNSTGTTKWGKPFKVGQHHAAAPERTRTTPLLSERPIPVHAETLERRPNPDHHVAQPHPYLHGGHVRSIHSNHSGRQTCPSEDSSRTWRSDTRQPNMCT
ncbi:hypothetical protein PhCBS80983_g06041 [Powellomyces hirtus]|uniref:MHYT domain-containing protein n=1 Tax=Powellomyces hirtus TaxID=109895 RepID=A0A507DS89_9FUNG|nr:hypothetical protein PhCBS80983_g06041 [Powellomyces hirtus]